MSDSALRSERRRLKLESKLLAPIGAIVILAVVAFGLLAAYATPLAVASPDDRCGCGHPYWTEGLTEQQIAEIRQKIWDIRTQASAEGWTEEQTTTAIHQLLAQYGISPRGPGFVDANGDGVCDHFRNGHGRRQRGNQCWNQTVCPQT